MARPKKEKELRHTHQIMLRLPDTEYEIVSTNQSAVFIKNCVRGRKRWTAFHVSDHQVLNAKGILSGAKVFETPEMQKRLLEAEGVHVRKTDAGRRVELL